MNFHDLVDADILAAADERHQAARERLKATTAALETATASHAAAKVVSDAAISGSGTVSAMDAELALEAAARSLSVAGKVRSAAAVAHDAARENLDAAKGVAHVPVYRAGIANRLAAAWKADAARALLAAAQADYDTATEQLNFATRAGCQHVVYDAGHNHTMGSHDDEIKRWSRPNGWWDRKPGSI